MCVPVLCGVWGCCRCLSVTVVLNKAINHFFAKINSSAPLLPPPSPYPYLPCVRLHCVPCHVMVHPEYAYSSALSFGQTFPFKLVLVKINSLTSGKNKIMPLCRVLWFLFLSINYFRKKINHFRTKKIYVSLSALERDESGQRRLRSLAPCTQCSCCREVHSLCCSAPLLPLLSAHDPLHTHTHITNHDRYAQY